MLQEAGLEVVRSQAEIVRTQPHLEVPHQDLADFEELKSVVGVNLATGQDVDLPEAGLAEKLGLVEAEVAVDLRLL